MKTYLLTPGPTPIPEEVYAAFTLPIIHHRAPDFIKTFKKVKEDLKYTFQTKNDVVMTTSSGTGSFEAAIGACFTRGEKIITIEGGKFGERWTQVANRYGIETITLKPEFGYSFKAEQIKEMLDKNPDVKGVIMVASETSTGVCHPVEEVAKLIKNTDKLMFVDAITALGVFPVRTDDWGLDVVGAGSQKAFMLPPGLGMVSVSDKAKKKMETTPDSPSFYLDLKKELKGLAKDQTAYTPAVSLIQGLEVALRLMKEETMEKIWHRHSVSAKACRASAQALGLNLFAKENPSNSITSIELPSNVDGKALVKDMRDNHGIVIAGGQAHMAGKIVRFAHLGYIFELDIIIGLTAFEYALQTAGYKNFKLGDGVKAAMEVFQKERLK